MKKSILLSIIILSVLINPPVFSQTESDSLGLIGDNLNLFAVLEIFQNSPTIEDFEKTLNAEKTGINNLDLNLDSIVDFIKVETKQNGDDFSFILRVDINEKETQDVAVILVSKDKDGKVSLQIVGDELLFGENYIVEPTTVSKPSVTANPAYTGPDTVVISAPATTTVVVVESTPIVQYVYSPVYVPYYPPYYYAYYPPYYAPYPPVRVNIYWSNCNYHGYPPYHGHGNTVVIHNNKNYNNYNNNYRNASNTVNHNNANGNYNGNSKNASNNVGNKPSTLPATKPSGTPSTRPSNTQPASRPATTPSTRPANTQPASRPATTPSTRPSSPTPSTRTETAPSNNNYSQPSTRPSNGSHGGGGRSGGGMSGGGSRGGGGRR